MPVQVSMCLLTCAKKRRSPKAPIGYCFLVEADLVAGDANFNCSARSFARSLRMSAHSSVTNLSVVAAIWSTTFNVWSITDADLITVFSRVFKVRRIR